MENKFFSSSNVQMWELDHKEGWVPKNWYFQIVVLEKTPERPFDCKKMKPVNRKGNQPWILIGRTDAEAEAPILWPHNTKSQLTGKDSDTGKDWGFPWGKGGDRGWDGWMASPTQWDMILSKLWEIVKDRDAWYAAVLGVAKIRHNLANEQAE